MTTKTERRKIGLHEAVPLSSRWPEYRMWGRVRVRAMPMAEDFAIQVPKTVNEAGWLEGLAGDWLAVDAITGTVTIWDAADWPEIITEVQ